MITNRGCVVSIRSRMSLSKVKAGDGATSRGDPLRPSVHEYGMISLVAGDTAQFADVRYSDFLLYCVVVPAVYVRKRRPAPGPPGTPDEEHLQQRGQVSVKRRCCRRCHRLGPSCLDRSGGTFDESVSVCPLPPILTLSFWCVSLAPCAGGVIRFGWFGHLAWRTAVHDCVAYGVELCVCVGFSFSFERCRPLLGRSPCRIRTNHELVPFSHKIPACFLCTYGSPFTVLGVRVAFPVVLEHVVEPG